jgi:hypothetical protein
MILISDEKMPNFNTELLSQFHQFKSVLPKNIFKSECARQSLSQLCQAVGFILCRNTIPSDNETRIKNLSLKVGDSSYQSKNYRGNIKEQVLYEYAALEFIQLISNELICALNDKLEVSEITSTKEAIFRKKLPIITATIQSKYPAIFDAMHPKVLAPCVKSEVMEKLSFSKEEINFFFKTWTKRTNYLRALRLEEYRSNILGEGITEILQKDRGHAMRHKRNIKMTGIKYTEMKTKFPLLFTKPYVPFADDILDQLTGLTGTTNRASINRYIRDVQNNPVYLDTLTNDDSYKHNADGSKAEKVPNELKAEGIIKLKANISQGASKYRRRLGKEVFDAICERHKIAV